MKTRIIFPRLLIIVLLTAFVQLSGGCSGITSLQRDSSLTDSSELNRFYAGDTGKIVHMGAVTADDIITTARQYLGTRHCMGGTDTTCMDCSGLLYRVFLENGIRLPHNSEEIARFGTILQDKSDLRKGDLVFFKDSYNSRHFITHSGIYLGNNEFIHTSSTSGVSISSLDAEWWRDKFVFGTRLLK